ncbi:Mannosyl-oligosaccharide 1,2-alpha-mannosidase IB [Blyttiomyces sp. JEL0837]|nr:Mannosyl-oligosaccharide 1,2-alpha-mannosidase IB [Blyttiomyces sp. JEL0837]
MTGMQMPAVTAAYWAPQIGMSWNDMIGTIPKLSSTKLSVYVIDIEQIIVNGQNPSTFINSAHAAGSKVLCYVGTWTDYSWDASTFCSADLGNSFPNYPGQKFVNFRSTCLRNVMLKRFQRNQGYGCDGIHGDVLDAFTLPNQGISPSLTATDAYNYASWIATQVHGLNMSIGFTNADNILPSYPSFPTLIDFIIIESCMQYTDFSNTKTECYNYDTYIANGKPVFAIEYGTSSACSGMTAAQLAAGCTEMNNHNFEGIQKTCDLGLNYVSCQTYVNGVRTPTIPSTTSSSSKATPSSKTYTSSKKKWGGASKTASTTIKPMSPRRLKARSDPPRWNPAIGMSWQWLIGYSQDITILPKTAMYDADVDNGFNTTTAHNAQAKAICYVGSLEIGGGRPDEATIVNYNKTVQRILGPAYPGWPGEYFLDIRNSQVRVFMLARFQRMQSLGCDAIEPDNIDTYVNNGAGFGLTIDDAKNYLDWISTNVHSLGMSVALKNGGDILIKYPDLVNEFDFTIVESCFKYAECNVYYPFIIAGKPVLSMEYNSGSCGTISNSKVPAACNNFNSYDFEGLVSDCNLDKPAYAVCQTGYDASGIRTNTAVSSSPVSTSSTSTSTTTKSSTRSKTTSTSKSTTTTKKSTTSTKSSSTQSSPVGTMRIHILIISILAVTLLLFTTFGNINTSLIDPNDPLNPNKIAAKQKQKWGSKNSKNKGGNGGSGSGDVDFDFDHLEFGEGEIERLLKSGSRRGSVGDYFDPVEIGEAKVGLNLREFVSYANKSRDRGCADVKKMEYIRKMTQHAWKGYKKYAWGHDELKPVSKKHHDWHSTYQLLHTPIDSLDTLLIMNLTTEYNEAKKLILDKLKFDDIKEPFRVSVFETTIRVLGGLLSAFELEVGNGGNSGDGGDVRLLDLARKLADLLLVAFDTENGLPLNHLDLSIPEAFDSPKTDSKTIVGLATSGSLQLEFQYLSDLTGNDTYAKKALLAYEQFYRFEKPIPGFFPKHFKTNSKDFMPTNEVGTDIKEHVYSIGASGDSFYEYLLKIYLSTGEKKYFEWYMESAEAFLNHMATTSPKKKLVYMPKLSLWYSNDGSTHFTKETGMEHLSCFSGGMFALGATVALQLNLDSNTVSSSSSSTSSRKLQEDLYYLGSNITETCSMIYKGTKTGLGPEVMDMKFFIPNNGVYMLRPETVESLFYMWRLTHNPHYRERGWEIVKALEQQCRIKTGGYAGLVSVELWGEHKDLMNSFYLAETLKYLYLLFTDDDVIPLEKYVFNTEAHPFAVRGHGRRSDPTKLTKVPVTPEDFPEEDRKKLVSDSWKKKSKGVKIGRGL